MSFILDALKKSESERSRQTGPVLMDVRIAAPRRHLPAWVWAIGAVLLANLALLAFLLLRNPAAPTPAPAVAAAAGTTAAAPPAVTTPATAPAAALPMTTAPTPTVIASTAAVADTFVEPAATIVLPPPAAVVQRVPEPQPPATSNIAGNEADLPTAQDLTLAGVSLPQLQLNLHVYDPNPANRYVLLNGVRLHEGEFTAEGVKLERITVSGLVLESNGRRFRLNAGG